MLWYAYSLSEAALEQNVMETVCKILHDPHVAPTHQYFASYRYFERVYQADVIIHGEHMVT